MFSISFILFSITIYGTNATASNHKEKDKINSHQSVPIWQTTVITIAAGKSVMKWGKLSLSESYVEQKGLRILMR